MDAIQKQAIKDLLHMIVDKEELPVVIDLLGKLPPTYAAMAQALAQALMPVAVSGQDKAIDSL